MVICMAFTAACGDGPDGYVTGRPLVCDFDHMWPQDAMRGTVWHARPSQDARMHVRTGICTSVQGIP